MANKFRKGFKVKLKVRDPSDPEIGEITKVIGNTVKVAFTGKKIKTINNKTYVEVFIVETTTDQLELVK